MTAREKRLDEGICIWCGKAPARENRQMCEQCAQRQRENVKNVRKTWGGAASVQAVRRAAAGRGGKDTNV